jgi:hypothetical protein
VDPDFWHFSTLNSVDGFLSITRDESDEYLFTLPSKFAAKLKTAQPKSQAVPDEST